jgi:hypothetical protein
MRVTRSDVLTTTAIVVIAADVTYLLSFFDT